jgi:hypothetical protein
MCQEVLRPNIKRGEARSCTILPKFWENHQAVMIFEGK